VSRLKLLSRMPALRGSALASLRFVAVSATIPNVADVGAWIGAPPGHAPSFGDEYRACALEVKGASRKLHAEGNVCGMCASMCGDVTRCDAPSFRVCFLCAQCMGIIQRRATSSSNGARVPHALPARMHACLLCDDVHARAEGAVPSTRAVPPPCHPFIAAI
jgi:hypothetical protein